MGFELNTVWRWPLLRNILHKPNRIPSRPALAQIHLTQPTSIHIVAEHYLSFSIDISVLAGGYWWEGSKQSKRGLGTLRIPPLDLTSRKLNLLAQALAPAVLRVGGSEADKIHYFSAPDNEPDSLVLHRDTWDKLHQFTQKHNFLLSFTIKYGLFKRSQHGQWNDSEVETLLRYSQAQGYRIDICELGNELNAYWAFHGVLSQPRAHHLAADYHTFAQVVKRYQPQAKIIGPGSAFWPILGETIKPFSNITKRFMEICAQQGTPIHIIDWHYYPFQSLRSPVRTRTATLQRMLKPKSLNDFKKYSQQLKIWRDQYFPEAQIWTGETGSAQCGGQPKLSDRFISCFWWADQLGQGGLQGQSVMIRQSLIGGEYGLVDRLTLKPRPDYWLSWLWKSLMGTEVYSVSAPHPMLRAYCHNRRDHLGKSLLIINLSARAIKINAGGFGKPDKQYALTAKRLKSKKIRINGVKARFRGGQFTLEDFPPQPHSDSIAPHSINFWLFD